MTFKYLYKWDISILHPLLRLRECYPTLPNYFFMTTTTTKLPQTTITFRKIDSTLRFNNAKIQTHALGSICVRRDRARASNDTLTF